MVGMTLGIEFSEVYGTMCMKVTGVRRGMQMSVDGETFFPYQFARKQYFFLHLRYQFLASMLLCAVQNATIKGLKGESQA